MKRYWLAVVLLLSGSPCASALVVPEDASALVPSEPGASPSSLTETNETELLPNIELPTESIDEFPTEIPESLPTVPIVEMIKDLLLPPDVDPSGGGPGGGNGGVGGGADDLPVPPDGPGPVPGGGAPWKPDYDTEAKSLKPDLVSLMPHASGLPTADEPVEAAPADATSEETPDQPAVEPLMLPQTSVPAARPPTQTAAVMLMATVGLIAPASGLAVFPGWRRALARLLKGAVPAGLYSRLSEAAVLAHPKRSLIHEFVKQNPGERLVVMQRQLGLGHGTMLHHLKILDARDLVRVRTSHGIARLFLAGPAVKAGPYLSPLRRRILDLLRKSPGITQRQIASSFAATERVVSYHVGHLRSAGLVTVERRGTAHFCFPTLNPGQTAQA